MNENYQVQVELIPNDDETFKDEYDLDRVIYDLETQIDLFSSQADKFDYLVSIGSGILCGLLDIFWVSDINLERGREISSDKIDCFVKKTANLLGCKKDDLESAVRFLEKKFPIPSDDNMSIFGGGLQHHLRDFAHHPTIVGLMFSILMQFTYKSYGTDTKGNFIFSDVTDAGKVFIGDDVPSKIINGTITWFFHLISDMAGSSSSVGSSGGTGIPGPLLALAKELSVLPLFKNMKIEDKSITQFLSKIFNGKLLATHDESGKIVRDSVLNFDLRGELGLGIEIGRLAIPVAANECIVRSFYFYRRLAIEIQENNIQSFSDLKHINWDKVKFSNNPTVARMLTIATSVFTAIDIGEAVVSQKYWVAINYVGVGRFAVAIGEDVSWCLKARNVKKIKMMYENIKRFVYMQENDNLYERIETDMNNDKFGLTVEQTEILYNLEYYKTLNDIHATKMLVGNDGIKKLKKEWLDEWKEYITKGFTNFLQIEGMELHWYTEQDLNRKIQENDPNKIWFRLVMLEAMLFEPYYPLCVEKNKKGDRPSKKYSQLQLPLFGYAKITGDIFLDSYFIDNYYQKGYIKRFRKCYDKIILEMKEVLKGIIIGGAITAGIAIITIATAGAFAPAIAVALVGSNFAGLNGVALTSACLAYLGGGAIAVGGAGMAGGTIAIVGGGAVLGIGAGLCFRQHNLAKN